jgi:drug/metabolite transporter (DMT)-like permease
MNGKNVHLSGIIAIASAMIICGTIGVFVTESGQSAFNVVFFRCLFASMFLGIYCLATKQIKKEYFLPRILLPVAGSGIAIVFNWFFLFKAFKASSITLSMIFYYTQPFILLLLGVLFLKDRIKTQNILWLLIAFAGFVFSTGIASSHGVSNTQLMGGSIALIAAILYAIAIIVAKNLKDVPAPFIAFAQTTIGVFLLYPFTDLTTVPSTGSHWFYLVSLGGIHTAFAYVLFYKGVKMTPTAIIAVLGFFEPVVAIITDVCLYGQTVTYMKALGIVLILFGGLAVNMNLELRVPRLAFAAKE